MRRRARQMLVHRVLRFDDRRQREAGADAAEERLQRLASRHASRRVDWCDGNGLRLVGSLSHERSLAPDSVGEAARSAERSARDSAVQPDGKERGKAHELHTFMCDASGVTLT